MKCAFKRALKAEPDYKMQGKLTIEAGIIP